MTLHTGHTPTRRTLYVLRHADAERARPGLDDHDRDLTPTGERAAEELGARLRAPTRPLFVLTSSALRARRTARLACAGLEREITTRVAAQVYRATAAQLLEVVRTCPDDVHDVLLVGHLPAVRDLARELGESPEEPWHTAALAAVDFDAPAWSEVAASVVVDVRRP